MRQMRYCVRIVQTHTDDGTECYEGGNLGTFVECLRHAGLVTVHQTQGRPYSLTSLVFDLECPHKTGSKEWAEQVAERMQSFGFLAAAAPTTKEGDG